MLIQGILKSQPLTPFGTISVSNPGNSYGAVFRCPGSGPNITVRVVDSVTGDVLESVILRPNQLGGSIPSPVKFICANPLSYDVYIHDGSTLASPGLSIGIYADQDEASVMSAMLSSVVSISPSGTAQFSGPVLDTRPAVGAPLTGAESVNLTKADGTPVTATVSQLQTEVLTGIPIAGASVLGGVKSSPSVVVDSATGIASVPTATSSQTGIVKPGAGMSAAGDGSLSVNSVPSTIVYVDANRTDTYTENGTIDRPFKSADNAIAALASVTSPIAMHLAPYAAGYTHTAAIVWPAYPVVIFGNNATFTAAGGITLQAAYVSYDLNFVGNATFSGASTDTYRPTGGSHTGNITVTAGTLQRKNHPVSGTITTSGTGRVVELEPNAAGTAIASPVPVLAPNTPIVGLRTYVIGDSHNAYGLGASSDGLLGYGYLHTLYQEIQALTQNKRTITNIAVGGKRTDEIAAIQVPVAIAAQPNEIIDASFTNDIIQRVGLDSWETRIAIKQAYYKQILAAGIRLVSYICPPNTGWSSTQAAWYARHREWVYDFARRNTGVRIWDSAAVPGLIDRTSATLAPNATWVRDGIHLSETGAYQVAAWLLASENTYLGPLTEVHPRIASPYATTALDANVLDAFAGSAMSGTRTEGNTGFSGSTPSSWSCSRAGGTQSGAGVASIATASSGFGQSFQVAYSGASSGEYFSMTLGLAAGDLTNLAAPATRDRWVVMEASRALSNLAQCNGSALNLTLNIGAGSVIYAMGAGWGNNNVAMYPQTARTERLRTPPFRIPAGVTPTSGSLKVVTSFAGAAGSATVLFEEARIIDVYPDFN